MKKVGQYELGPVLGQGGMGTVYKALDSRFDRTVAIKVLHGQFASDPLVVERFKSEAVIQAKLSHPHIVTVFDFISENGTLAFVMEYIDGRPLDLIIERNGGPLPEQFACEVGRQVCWALQHAHRLGLVHRDIKPSNILVAEYGSRVHVKVNDFGVAKILGTEKMRTATSAKMGTLAYMSPEQLRSPKSVDHRADLYSLGVTLYEMVSGVTPFDADTEYDLMRQIVESAPKSLPTEMPAGLRKAVSKALEKSVERRFQTAQEFESALGETESRNIISPHPARAQNLAPNEPVPDNTKLIDTLSDLYEGLWPKHILTGILFLVVVYVLLQLNR